MHIDDMFERVITMSGQFLLKKENLDLDVDRFRYLVDSVLGDWNSCRQRTDILSFSSLRKITFTEAHHAYGIPDCITKVIPNGTLGFGLAHSSRLFGSRFHHGNEYHSNEWLEIKEKFPFEYRKPHLHLPYTCNVEVHAAWDFVMRKETINGNSTWYVDGITAGDITFFELLRARFMYAIGRQRNAFTMQDLSISLDAQDLINEGLQLEERALERLHTKDKQWYLAWGG